MPLTATPHTPPAAASFQDAGDFYQRRDFGQKWEATAQLLRQHGRPLLLVLLRYALPWVLVGSLVQAYGAHQRYLLDSSTGLTLLGQLLKSVGEVVGTAIVFGFLRLRLHMYQSPGYRLTAADIWEATQNTGLYFGKYLTMVLLLLAGLLLMIVPSLYVYVVMGLLPGVVFMEQDGLTRTFELIKGYFWSTAALTAVVLGLNLGIELVPSTICGYFLREAVQADSELVWPLLAAQQLIEAAARFVLLPVREVLLAFQYFNIVEAKESPGLAWRAAHLGEAPAAAAPAPDSTYAPTDDYPLL